MSSIITRAGKGSKLTHGEVDANFNNLNADKIEKSALGANTILTKNNAGDLSAVSVPTSRLVGRKSSGEIMALTVAEVKALLSIAIADVSGLQAALDAKLPLSAFASDNSLVFKNNSGTIGELVVAASRILGRGSSGEIKALTDAEVKTLLGLPTLAEGTFTPVAEIVSNLVSITPHQATYIRIGSKVYMSGMLTLNITTPGSLVNATLTLPIAPAMTEVWHATGNITGLEGSSLHGTILANAASSYTKISIDLTPKASGSRVVTYSCMYRV